MKASSGEERERKENQDPAASLWSVREHLTNSIRGKLNKLLPSHSSNCIYRVPETLRKVNGEAFTPRLVSIGPLHVDKSQLQAMEEYKLRCLKSFFDSNVDILAMLDFIVGEEETIRRHYQDKSGLSSDAFSEMILLDSVFIVQLLLKSENDGIFDKRWMKRDLLHDLMLLENQIPLCVPHTIYAKYSRRSNGKFFGDLIHDYLKESSNAPSLPMQVVPTGSNPPRHLVEYLRMAYIPDPGTETRPTEEKSKFEHSRSATELLQAGVKFKAATETKRLVQIDFKEGVLTIPQLKVNEWTETFFRNLIAFEQCERTSPRYISDYIIFMDDLINTPKDVDVLKKYKIIENSLNDSEEVSNLFNNLHKEPIFDGKDFYFAQTTRELNEYSKNIWHQWKAKWFNWKAILKRDYFGSPWTAISLIAAIVLLVLTVVQTACSVLSL
ncbi:hypothetical protein NMG60_11027366 [Bertholletia excelsa]